MVDPTFNNSNILIIDDQEANIVILEGFLVMLGYTKIKSSTEPLKIVSLLKTFAPDLILLDLSMPHLSGFEVLQLLNPLVSKNTFIPILVLTTDITKEAKHRALSEGASDFLTKPFDLVEVGLRIKNLLFTRYLVVQLGIQNKFLEIKVKEQTHDLEMRNAELIKARYNAQANNRFKTAFINAISHEIRPPLSCILSFLPKTINPTFSDTESKEFIDILNLNSKYLIQTITDYFDIFSIKSDNMEINLSEFAPGLVVDEIQKLFQPQCNKSGITLKIQKQESFDSVLVNSDRAFIKKILTHLVDNALKFTKEGNITIGVSLKINLIEFYVKDTGIGISNDALSIISEHFLQADVSNTIEHEGGGLGLIIVKSLVSLLGGTIRVESMIGIGSTFMFTVPWVIDSTEIVRTIAPSYETCGIKRPIILIAEDEPYGFPLFELSLDKDYEIIRAEDGEEAVELCRLIPEILLVLMDLKEPKMNGLIATQEIKKFRENLPIIALTACPEADIRKKCFDAGCDEYLAKPVCKMKLLDKIKEFLIMA